MIIFLGVIAFLLIWSALAGLFLWYVTKTRCAFLGDMRMWCYVLIAPFILFYLIQDWWHR